MRRLLAALFGAAIILVSATGTVLATTNFDNAPEGAHYARGFAEPICSVSGVTVTCTNTQIGGVGHTNATVLLAVSNAINGVCHNPGNSNVVDPFTRTRSTSTSSNLTSTKNGQLIVPQQSTTGTSSADFLATFSCPNPLWTPEVTSNTLTFTYTLTFAGFTDAAITITGTVSVAI